MSDRRETIARIIGMGLDKNLSPLDIADAILSRATPSSADEPIVKALAAIKENACTLMRSYYEARGGHMIDGPTAVAETAYRQIEDTCDRLVLSERGGSERNGSKETPLTKPKSTQNI